jgi:hypothetical protein
MDNKIERILKRKRRDKWIWLLISTIGFLFGVGLGIWILVKIFLLGVSNT